MIIQNYTTDYRSLLEGFIEGKPVTIRFSYPAKETLKTINSIIAQTFSSQDRIFLLESMITIIRECIFNASKANAKRIFFESSGKDIKNREVYDKLISDFKTKVIQNFPDHQANLEASNYYADFTILKENDGINISVSNNVPLLEAEAQRISERIQSAAKYKDFSEVYEDMYDDTEGAGLGILLTIMILKNSGISPSLFSIKSDQKTTTAAFTVPNLLRPHELSTHVKTQIIQQISMLPTFPSTTMELISMCEDPKASIPRISEKIMNDPSLTADILKLANSAGFISSRRIENISDALVRIGMKNVKFMLMAASSRQILEKRFKKFEMIWIHCIKTAIYAKTLATELKIKGIEEQAFICGLLHDMGKIVLLSVDLEITNKIAEIVEQHRIRTTTVIEEISIGISHSAIGKLIAEKWNFAEFLLQGIEFHHSPLMSRPEYRNIVSITYLANLFCGIETKKYEYSYADTIICEALGIKDENELMAIHQKVASVYVAQSK